MKKRCIFDQLCVLISFQPKRKYDNEKYLLHPVLGSPVKPWIHWQLQTWLKGVPKALGPQGHCMQGSEQVKLLTSNLSL